MADADPVAVLDFMLVRPPLSTDRSVALRRQIRDDALGKGSGGHREIGLTAAGSPSAVARMVVQRSFTARAGTDPQALAQIRAGVLSFLPAHDTQSVDIRELEERGWWKSGTQYHLLPDRLAALGGGVRRLPDLLILLRTFAAEPEPSDPAAAQDWQLRLAKALTEFHDGTRPAEVVYSGPAYSAEHTDSRRILFDALYLLYLARRWVPTRFEEVMDGLRALHALRAAAIDDLYRIGLAGGTGWQSVLQEISGDLPRLRRWQGRSELAGLPLLHGPADLAEHLAATPVVHPIFARLIHYGRPFNDLQPLGVGDLKLVHQQLLGYRDGEIADIHNVMLGETLERNHRRLERTEETFSTVTSSSSSTSTDTSSTDRFELKREVEAVVKTDLNVTANLRAQYDNKVVLVAAQAGMAYTRATSDQTKLAQNYSREVVDKAVSQVQSSTVATRTIAQLFETEETNKHSFTNVSGTSHVSGIYRWVDKLYRAQVLNYGKRMMFEFVLPEPAAMLVESRLRSFEMGVDVPTRPAEPTYRPVQLPFGPHDITDSLYANLRETYDLSSVPKPPQTRTVIFRDDGSGQANFVDKDINGTDIWYFKSFRQAGADGYQIDRIMIAGGVWFTRDNPPNPAWHQRNILDLTINGVPVYRNPNLGRLYHAYYRSNDDFTPDGGPLPLSGDETTLTIGLQNGQRYQFEISAQLSLSPAGLYAWQQQVYHLCLAAKRAEVERTNAELRAGHDAAMATYRNRLDDLRAMAVHDLLQGTSEQANAELIRTELRRQCLARITRDFDAVRHDDQLTEMTGMGTRPVSSSYHRFAVDQERVGWTEPELDVELPLVDVDKAVAKGRHIQFLEQAFEWGRIGWVHQPYFWAPPARWIDMMNRTDDTDPAMTAFLRAGAVKVLVAVSPGYDEAVLHFLATREPWLGGPAPVIGDPLYLPLFEELRDQTDDRAGAVADGEPWTFTLPTSLVHLEGSSTPLPTPAP